MMVKRFASLLAQNLVLTFRNALVWILIGTLVLMIAVVRFAIPAEYNLSQAKYYLDNTPDKIYEHMLRETGVTEQYFPTDLQTLEEVVKGDSSAVGIVFNGSTAQPTIVLLHHGKISRQNQNVLEASLEQIAALVSGNLGKRSLTVEFLRAQIEPVPRNLSTVPVLIVFEVLVLGFLLVAVFIFQEKSDGSIRAYRISPGGTTLYILSKILAFLVIGLLYGVLLVFGTIGLQVNYFLLLALLTLGFILYTLIGLIVAVFFNSISEWFFVGVSVLTLNMAPVFAHEFPAFSPAFLTWLPSYSIIFGMDEILFPSGKSLLPLIILLVFENVVAYVICHRIVEKKLMKEGNK